MAAKSLPMKLTTSPERENMPVMARWVVRAAFAKLGNYWGTLTVKDCAGMDGCPAQEDFSCARRLAPLCGFLDCRPRAIMNRFNACRVPERPRPPDDALGLIQYYRNVFLPAAPTPERPQGNAQAVELDGGCLLYRLPHCTTELHR